MSPSVSVCVSVCLCVCRPQGQGLHHLPRQPVPTPDCSFFVPANRLSFPKHQVSRAATQTFLLGLLIHRHITDIYLDLIPSISKTCYKNDGLEVWFLPLFAQSY